MAVTMTRQDSIGSPISSGRSGNTCEELRRGQEPEVLRFLATRPVHTVYMAGLIRDNGLASLHNRGSFYACRDRSGALDGVGLIGHATMIEARTEKALLALSALAADCRNTHLVRGERHTIENFRRHQAVAQQKPRLICRELMLVRRQPFLSSPPVDGLRKATLDDLQYVVDANTAMAFEEGGISPLKRDPAGFRLRTERRIHQGRVWVWLQDRKPIFKADIIALTPEAIYLEGIHVHPEERRKGYGKRCLTQLGSILLAHTQSVCLTINQQNAEFAFFYAQAGFEFDSEYETIYVN